MKDDAKPDFEALRATRNAAVKMMIADIAAEHGWDTSEVYSTFDADACFCACSAGGPCEHDFQGWRDITNEYGEVCGGETYCQRCGMGSMSHSLHYCDF